MSAVHVGELTSEVVSETEPDTSGGPARENDWEERLRELHERFVLDAARTRADGFDD